MSTRSTVSSALGRVSTERLELAWFILLTVWFVVQGYWFLAYTPFGLPPDEPFHARLVALFAGRGDFFIDPSTVDAWHGTGAQSFFFYHWLLGQLAALLYPEGSDPLPFLRGFSLLLGVAYLVVFQRLARLLSDSPLTRALALLAQSSLLMFVFINSAVSYDCLTNLCSIILVCAALTHVKAESPAALLAALIATGIGTLTKVTFLPLAFLVWLGLVYHPRHSLLRPLLLTKRLVRTTRVGKALAVGAFLAVTLNVAVTARSVSQYGAIWPGCPKVYSVEQCMRDSPVHRKTVNVGRSRDRHERLMLDPVRYGILWADRMVEQSVGIFAYKSYYPPTHLLGLLELVLLIAAGISIYRLREQPRVVRYALLLTLLFLLITCYGHNYQRYLKFGIFPRYTFLAMQGRYSFPVIALVILLVCRALMGSKRPALRGATFVGSAALILALGFPGFMMRGANVIQNGTLQDNYRKQLFHMHDFVDP